MTNVNDTRASRWMKWIIGNRKVLHPKAITFEASREDVEVEGAVQYDDQYSENTCTVVNNIKTHEHPRVWAKTCPCEAVDRVVVSGIADIEAWKVIVQRHANR